MSMHLSFPSDVAQLCETIVESCFFQRLKNVAFLGAIDLGSQGPSPHSAGSRFEHSLGVASLVLRLTEPRRLSEGEFRIALVHALYHDIGHGPFSHSSEPFFRQVHQIDHHQALIDYIADKESEPSRILRKFGLWNDYRKYLIDPASLPDVNLLFGLPINVDTIEGVTRSAEYFGLESFCSPSDLAGALARRSPNSKPLDEFWRLKSTIYNEYILGSEFGHYDELLSIALFALGDRISRDDFFLDDHSFQAKHGQVFNVVTKAQCRRKNLRQRYFQINRDIKIRDHNSLRLRYRELGEPLECTTTKKSLTKQRPLQGKN